MFHCHTLCCMHLVSVLLNSSSSHVVTVSACTTSYLIIIFHLVVQLVYGWCVKSGNRTYAVGSHCVSPETAQAHIRNILFFCTHLSCNCYCYNPSQLALCPYYTGAKNKINRTLGRHIGEF